ncbi:MAG: arginine--tRNA ligase [Victivallaceae bacterium]|nr:arginine--tRNA ligase [Victivallaceae bacterium]
MKFLAELEAHLRIEFPGYPAENTLNAEVCPPGQKGDFTLNCFKIARFCGNPVAAAKAVGDFLAAHEEIEAVETVKAFVNVTLKSGALMRETRVADVDALLASVALPKEQCDKVLIEYSAPNTNKPQHLGHVRNNTLGMSLASLLKRVGHEVVEINLVNDRGIHICKSMLAYKLFGNGETPESTGIKGDHLVGNYYVKFNSELSAELKALRAARPDTAGKSDEELFGDTKLGAAAQKMLRDWEAGDPEVRALWQKMNSWVFAGFAVTYERMGIHFDHTYLESQTYLLGKDIVQRGLDAGVFTRRADNAVVCDLGKLGAKVVLRSDGTSVYITQDMGTTLRKYEDYSPDAMIWVVGDEQNLHFQMLFTIMKRLGYAWADKLFHLSYGMVNLPNGKMKSREGTVVDADDLFDEMSSLAATACRDRADGTLADDEIRKRGEIIGIGALKFMLLKFNPKTTMTFDPAASLKFEGDTGTYVQYAATRIRSMQRKAVERGLLDGAVDWELLGHATEKSLAVKLGFYPCVLQAAAAKRDCSGIVEYLLGVAKDFNAFYRECPVLNAPSAELARARLALAESAGRILTDGLRTLTISVPDAM